MSDKLDDLELEEQDDVKGGADEYARGLEREGASEVDGALKRRGAHEVGGAARQAADEHGLH